MRASNYRVRGVAERYSDAAELLRASGDCAIVERGGVQRQLVMKCPDGCGEILSINLDARSGRAWRLYKRKGKWSLYPSIDKPYGCGSHFILSHGKIVWCDFWDWPDDAEVSDQIAPVRTFLRGRALTSYVEIAEHLDAFPWDVLRACRLLVKRGVAEEGKDKYRGYFKLIKTSRRSDKRI